MPPQFYKVWQWGGAVSQGAMQSQYVGVSGVAKCASVENPFAVANELLCGNLARAVFLPVPPSFLVTKSGVPHHVSLDFNLAGQSLPPVDPPAVAKAHPELSVGVILFDAWIVNPDRHASNLAYDLPSGRLSMFDHSHAFYHGVAGRQWLEQQTSMLGIGGHCLAPAITDLEGARKWSDRIQKVPEFYIADTVAMAVDAGIPTGDKTFCEDFLATRRGRLLDLLHQHRALFPNVQPGLWDHLRSAT
jgi:HipA-like kinase